MTTTASTPASAAGPSVLDALALLVEVTDELVLRSVRDTHLAVADRVQRVTRRATTGTSALPEVMHRSIASAVYGGIGLGLRTASAGLDRAAATGRSPRLEADPRGRLVSAVVNGLIGDKLVRERPQMAIPMAVRRGGRDVELDTGSLRDAFPRATGRVVVFLHGLFENEESWDLHRERIGTTYGESVTGCGWTPVFLRANSGLPLRENGVALASLIRDLVERWPTEVTRIVLVGHSMGGLVIRAAGAVATEPGVPSRPWTDLVSDVVTLGTPHLGAPLARGIGHGSRGLGMLPETAAFGRILDWRSRGVHDLVAGLTEDVPPLPRARYHLVAATLTESERHPFGDLVGDLVVRPRSAYGRDRDGQTLFPGGDVLHVGHAEHFGLLNHPRVHQALRDWLG